MAQLTRPRLTLHPAALETQRMKNGVRPTLEIIDRFVDVCLPWDNGQRDARAPTKWSLIQNANMKSETYCLRLIIRCVFSWARRAAHSLLPAFGRRKMTINGNFNSFLFQRALAGEETWCHANYACGHWRKSNFPSTVRWLCANVSPAQAANKVKCMNFVCRQIWKFSRTHSSGSKFSSVILRFAKKKYFNLFERAKHHHHNDDYRKFCFRENWPRLSEYFAAALFSSCIQCGGNCWRRWLCDKNPNWLSAFW